LTEPQRERNEITEWTPNVRSTIAELLMVVVAGTVSLIWLSVRRTQLGAVILRSLYRIFSPSKDRYAQPES